MSDSNTNRRTPEHVKEANLPTMLKPRSAQLEFERGLEIHRICALVARRQFGKTTGVSRIALKKMMRKAGHDVVFGSVKLDLGREIVRKESAQLRQAFHYMERQAAQAKTLLKVMDGNKELPKNISADDYDDIYEACRLELRLYHSNSVYSRTKVVALTPDAVGETGDLILDEVGRAKKFREVCEAMWPIISSNPSFRLLLTTTPPPDDAHFSFELLAPPIGQEFQPNKRGNWYKTDHGVHVLRVDAWDAYADGVPMYDDDTGAAITPEQSRAQAYDKEAWDRNYGVKFVFGGSAACGFIEIENAQRRGLGRAKCVVIDQDTDFDAAITWLRTQLGVGPVGIGWDLATTEKATSNPSSITVMEARGEELVEVAVIVFKTKDPAVAKYRIRQVVIAVRERASGGRARRLCIDATNERFFALEVSKELAGEVPVELVIGSETVQVPGKDEPITTKQYHGGRYVAALHDNKLTLPPERYIKEDHRLPRMEKGQFTCEATPDGKHGDTFDSGKLALHALTSNSGAIREVEGIVIEGYNSGGFGRNNNGVFVPTLLA